MFGTFLALKPKGHENLAQGLPWEKRSSLASPEGSPAFLDGILGRLVSRRPFQGLQR
jgi:hypothetical protein